jgi:hypothetical protein
MLPFHAAKGRHRIPFGTCSDRWPFATGLVSYLSSYLLFSGGRRSFWESPAVRMLLHVRGHRRPSDAFLTEHSLRDGLIRFHFPAATPELIGGDCVLFVQNRRIADHHTGSQ